ncbi:MAG: hypothetical protein H6744_19835 [Deltaproteobacteria bacterium]|nr:hypothetical protein [Deltaproteobacteria bacterium]
MSTPDAGRVRYDLSGNELELLRRCADLNGLDDAALTRLAEIMEPWLYPAGHVLYGRDDDPATRPLRLIIYGQVVVTQERQHHTRGEPVVRRTLVSGTLFGEEVLAPLLGAPDPRIRYSAETVGQTVVLELSAETLRTLCGRRTPETEVFWSGRRNALVAHLEEASRMSALAPELVVALAATEELSKLREEHLYALLEGATFIVRDGPDDVPLARAGELPDAFWVVVSGTLVQQLSYGSGMPVNVGPDGCVGLVECLWREPLTYDVYARGRVTLVCIAWRRVRHLLALHPELFRALQRAGGDERELRLDTHALRSSRYDIVLIEEDEQLSGGLPLDGLANLLAWAIATHLYDRVVVVHLSADGEPPPPLHLSPRPQRGYHGRLSVRHLYCRMPPRPDALAAAIAELLEPLDDPAPDLVLIDASTVSRLRRAALAELPSVATVIFVTDRRGAVPPVHLLLARAQVVPLALLAPEPPPLTWLMSLAEARRALPDGAPTTTLLRAAHTIKASQRLPDWRRVMRRLRDDLHIPRAGHARQPDPPWPPHAVRLRPTAAVRAALDAARDPAAPVELLPDDAVTEALGRIARAVTDRRVGVALGGGGAFGYVHIPLLRRLAQVGVPVDAVSGSSYGAIIAACYCARGEAGLRLIEEYGGAMFGVLPAALVTTAGFEVAVDLALGRIDLNDLEIPCFPVATEAHDAREHDVRDGTLGEGVRASNSLPPFAPTIRPGPGGYLRLLDGGLVANVPVAVLRQEGLSLTIGSNPVPSPGRLGRTAPRPIPAVLDRFIRQVDVLTRALDTLRSPFMLLRAASESQRDVADVMFRATTRGIHSGAVHKAREIIEQAQAPPLERAIQLALREWRARLRNPPELVGLDDEAHELTVRQPVAFRDAVDGERLTRESIEVLDELARFVDGHPEISLVSVRARRSRYVDARRARMRAERVRDQLAAQGLGPRLGPVEVAHGFGDQFELSFPVKLLTAQAQQRALAEAQRARGEALAARLVVAAEHALDQGRLALGRLLTLESARLERSPRSEGLLRRLVEQRSRVVARVEGRGSGSAPATPVRALSYSPDGRRVAVGTRGGLVLVLDGSSGERLASWSRESDGVAGLCWDPAGRRLLVTWRRGGVGVLAPGRGAKLREAGALEGAGGAGFAASWSPDGSTVLAGRPEGGVWLWRPEDEGAARALDGPAAARVAAFSPDGRRVAVGGEDGRVRVHELDDARGPVRVLPGGDGPLSDLAFSPDGRRLAVARGREGELHDLEQPDAPPLRLQGHRRRVVQVAWFAGPGPLWVATASRDGSCRVWSGETGALRTVLTGHDAPLEGVAWHPQRYRLLTWSADGSARAWSPVTSLTYAQLTDHEGAVRRAAWSPDGTRIATASEDGWLRIWEPDVRLTPVYSGDHEPIADVSWAPGREQGPVLTSGDYGVVTLWDPRSGEQVAALAAASGGRAWAAWSPDAARVLVGRAGAASLTVWTLGAGGGGAGSAAGVLALERRELPVARGAAERCAWSSDGGLVAGGGPGGLAVLDVESGEAVRAGLGGDGAPVCELLWHPSERRLAVATGPEGGPQRVRVLRLDGRRARAPVELDGHASPVRAMAFDPTGMFLATGTRDGVVRVFDARSGALVATRELGAAAQALAFSPDGALLAVGDEERRVRIYRVGAFEAVLSEDAHRQQITAMAFSPDGSLLATAAGDGRCLLWDMAAMSLRATLGGHHDAVRSITWSPDGRTLVAAGDDGTARVHAASFDDLVTLVGESALTRTLELDDWRRHFGPDVPHRPSWPPPSEAAPGAQAQAEADAG